MADLVVTSVAVDDAAVQLKSILDELENMSELWQDGDIWGHRTLEGAMDDFIDSWWVKREKLQDNIKDLQGKMEKAAETWGETEIQLAKSLEGE
ncbi:hypothetical protein ACFWEJ_21825 [Promicromonospora sp. NPDC060204]|uniref:hypothetical protein n=1 Tax=Promicromonospora sp. NPDC060204 TaxID=3347071 RepID=UPI0036689005